MSLRDWENRFYSLIRHGDAAAVAVAEPGDDGLPSVAATGYCLVVTYRRDGTPVPTPVWVAADGGRLVFESDADAPKVRRLRRDPHVRVARCNSRGRPLGPPVEATARILAPDEEPAAEAALAARHGVQRRIAQRLRPTAPAGPAYVEITAA
jgi:PPOX class probable F420-dependent enzyme